MLEYLKDVGNQFDTLFFLPAEDDEQIQIVANKYKDPGLRHIGNDIGDWWHILLFKCNEASGAVEKLDHFDAIFSDPREYISDLIPCGWYGCVAKKTTTSKVFLDDALDRFKELM